MALPKLIAEQLASAVLDHQLNRYKAALTARKSDQSIPLYASAIEVFSKLSAEDQRALISFLQVVVIDTASTVLGGIDGTTDIGSLDGSFTLLYDGVEVSGNLQDHFLASTESVFSSSGKET